MNLIKDGTRIMLGSAVLNSIFSINDAEEIKLLLTRVIQKQEKHFLDILYVCDRRACEKCSFPECQHTTNISHAKNFTLDKNGKFYEEKEVRSNAI